MSVSSSAIIFVTAATVSAAGLAEHRPQQSANFASSASRVMGLAQWPVWNLLVCVENVPRVVSISTSAGSR